MGDRLSRAGLVRAYYVTVEEYARELTECRDDQGYALVPASQQGLVRAVEAAASKFREALLLEGVVDKDIVGGYTPRRLGGHDEMLRLLNGENERWRELFLRVVNREGTSGVKKVTVKVTVLTRHAELTESNLEDIVYRIACSGEDLGSWEIESCEDVPPEAVRGECIKLGNDGGFFNDELEGLV